MTFHLVGAVDEVRRIVTGAGPRFQTAVRQQLLKEAHYLRGEMVKGIASQAPGGQAFAALSPMTLASRRLGGFGGTKALIRSGGLRGAISVVHVPGSGGIGGAVFVGVHRSARSENGSGKSLVNIADIQEYGRTFSITITPKMRKFLGMLHKEAGAAAAKNAPLTRNAKGQFKRGTVAKKKKGSSSGKITITIPARPFVRPVMATAGDPAAVRKRFVLGLAKALGGDFGMP